MKVKKNIPSLEERQYQLKNYFLQVAPDTDLNELDKFLSCFEMDEFPKKHLIIAEGDPLDYIYFICKGLTRNYYIKEGKEINHWFLKENMMCAPVYTLITGLPNFINYKTLEHTYVLKINHADMESCFYKYVSIGHLGRKLYNSYYAAFMKKTFDVLFLSAEERYKLFCKENADLVQRVPLQYIASYLGIQQETLSRLRSKY